MSKEVLILTIIGATTIIVALLSTMMTLTLVFDNGVLSVQSPLPKVWALNVTGTQASDTLTGTNKSDNIRGHGEDDMIFGLEGNDHIIGDMGDDTIHGDRGSDRMRGGEGDDLIFGDSGNDKLFGGPGDDSLTGGSGRDTFNCGDGDDTVTDYNPAKNETVSANYENTVNTTNDEDVAINIPPPNLPQEEEQAADDITISPFNFPLLEEEKKMEKKMIAKKMTMMMEVEHNKYIHIIRIIAA